MPVFTIITTARASIHETWKVEAATRERAEEIIWDGDADDSEQLIACGDRVDGDEEDREIVEVIEDDGAQADGEQMAGRAQDTAMLLLSLLHDAKSFVEGFAGDDAQEGIDGPDGLLARIRRAIVNIEEG